MADDLASFNKQIGALPIKLKRQLAGAIQVEADRLAAAIKAAAPVFLSAVAHPSSASTAQDGPQMTYSTRTIAASTARVCQTGG